MTDNVTKFYPKNAAQNPDNVLEQAIGEYEKVFVIGYNKDGDVDSRASMNLTPSEINYLIDIFKHKLLNGDYTA